MGKLFESIFGLMAAIFVMSYAKLVSYASLRRGILEKAPFYLLLKKTQSVVMCVHINKHIL